MLNIDCLQIFPDEFIKTKHNYFSFHKVSEIALQRNVYQAKNRKLGRILLNTIQGAVGGFLIGAIIGASSENTSDLRKEDYIMIYGGFGAIGGGVVVFGYNLATINKFDAF